jgi:hypothetical protein
MPGNPGAPYRVVRSEAIRQRLKQWGEAAEKVGLIDTYAEALQAIEEKLVNEPLTWGDPLYPLRHLELMIHRGIYWVFVVEYGVHERERVVFIKEYRLLPNNPLEPGQ